MMISLNDYMSSVPAEMDTKTERGSVKRFVLFLVIGYLSFADAALWRETRSFVLKKDELVKIMVKTENQGERLLTFRWTLYTDKALVVHERFDRIIGQHILYANHAGQSFRKKLLPEKLSEKDVPYIMVTFKKFDEKNATAQMDLYVIDRENRVVLDYLTKK